MCTVTIVPKGENDFVITSNRDEAPNRNTLIPDYYAINHVKVLFPKDEVSGGTWIGVSDKNRVVCVLNGGFVCHKRKSNYRKSRGVVAKDFMVVDNIVTTIKEYNFNDIEPFTIVIADWNAGLRFYEVVWDGAEKHFTDLPLEPKIWSSSTLYSNTMKQERKSWFEDFKSENKLDASSLLYFHKTAGKHNIDYGVVMDRGFVKTTSITQVEKKQNAVNMRYETLQDASITNRIFTLPQIVNG